MLSQRIRLFSFGLLATALLAGCDGGRPDEAECYDGSGVNQACYRVHECYSSAAIALCDGTDLANSFPDGFRKTCHLDQQEATDFCIDECEKVAVQNGLSAEDAEEMCQYSSAGVADDNGYDIECWDNMEEMNMPIDLSPEAVCPDPGVGDLPYIYCHGTAEPDDPAGQGPVDFDERQISYWQMTTENGEPHYTAASLPPAGACGYAVVTLPYEWLEPDDVCVAFCHDQIFYLDSNPGDSVEIVHDNCESFVAGSLCNGMPAPSGSYTLPITLSAAIAGGGGGQGSFSGALAYSTYDCGAATCPILLDSLTLSLDQPVTGVLSSSTASTPFVATSLTLSLASSISGSYASSSGAVSLRGGSLPLHVTGVIVDPAAGTSLSVDMVTYNAEPITGTLLGGSLTVSGRFDLLPGVSISFGTPAPQ